MKIRTFADVKVNIKTEDILKENVVYCLTFPNGKVYVGQTTRSLKVRLQEHCRNSFSQSHSSYMYKKSCAIRKYMTFSVSILYQGSDLSNQEEYYIKEYDTVKSGYNLTESGAVSGGFTGKTHSEETIEKMKSSSYWKGKNLTDEMKNNLSELRKKEFQDPEKLKANRLQKHNVRVAKYNLEGEFICEYDSIRDAARETTGDANNKSNIQRCLDKINKNGKPASCYGFTWKRIKNN